jgi:hypothetical protein
MTNDEGMTQAGNDELMLVLMLVITIGRRSEDGRQKAEGEHDNKTTDN